MSTVTQPDVDNTGRTVRIREDIWKAARKEAFDRETSITAVLDEVLRAHFDSPKKAA